MDSIVKSQYPFMIKKMISETLDLLRGQTYE